MKKQMISGPAESKETPKMETKHSMGFLKKAVALKGGAKPMPRGKGKA